MSVVPQAAHSEVDTSLFREHIATPHIDRPSPPSAVESWAQHVPRDARVSHVSATANETGAEKTHSSGHLSAADGDFSGECHLASIGVPQQPKGLREQSEEQNRVEHCESEQPCSSASSKKSLRAQGKVAGRRLHRVGEVRQQQGVTERTMARRLGMDLKSYRQLEDPATDLNLSQLMELQAALDVPVADLLVDHHALSRPTQERAKLLKVMKTAVALREAKINSRADRIAQMLCDQLIDLMPELADVSGWPQFGARRGASAIGKALQHPINTAGIVIPD